MRSVVRIIKRGMKEDLKISVTVKESRAADKGTPEIVRVVKGWIAASRDRRRAEAAEYLQDFKRSKENRDSALGQKPTAKIILSALILAASLGGNDIAFVAAKSESENPPKDSSLYQQGTASASQALSLQEAVSLALNNNLAALLARERQQEARGRAEQSRAPLLPNVTASFIQQDQTINLAANGFPLKLLPVGSFIGPFKSFDARLTLVQSIFNLTAIRQFEAGKIDVGIASLQEQLARQQVTTQTALAYLNVLSSDRSVGAAQANLDLAQSLLTLARHQHDAGTAMGVDVTRAETRVAHEQVQLAQAQTNSQQARLELLRIVGLPLERANNLILTDPLHFTIDNTLVTDAAVQEAQRDRFEVRIAEAEVRLNNYERRAAKAEQLPSIDFVADYGDSGNTPARNALPTRNFGVRLNVPIFNGGLTRGRVVAASSRQRQAEMQLSDIRVQVEQDVRLAITTLATAGQQVGAARQQVSLAERELQMSRDRFAAGVANNLEVVNAQTSLENARDAEVNALAQYNAARINLAAARGRAELFHW